MKILKPGKVERRKFVCPNCECEFVIYKSETMRYMDLETHYNYWAQCPCRDQIAWDKGEPYEEPMPTQTDKERLIALLDEMDIRQTEKLANFLVDNGVTFREDAP